MAARYTTKEGDRLDVLVYDHYGWQAGALEILLARPENHKLIRQGLVVPAGIEIYFPDIERQNQRPQRQVKLWDSFQGAGA